MAGPPPRRRRRPPRRAERRRRPLLAPARAARVERGGAARAARGERARRRRRGARLARSRRTWPGAGVGRLGIVDSDDVEVSNLHRQPLHFTPDVGIAEGAQRGREAALPQPRGARRALPGALRAARCSRAPTSSSTAADSFETRYEVNAACCAARVPLVEGGVLGLAGLVMAIRPGETACYRCAFPEPPPPLGAELRRGRRARPGRGRDRLAAGARGAEAARRARRRAARRVPPGRPARPRRSCA